MGLVSIALLIVAGILGASSLIIARKPDAKELIAKLTPYQGWIGVVAAVWGAWWTIDAVLNLALLTIAPVTWILWLATGVVLLLLGFILGIGLMKTFVSSPEAHAKADELLVKLSPYQGTLGIAAIALGVLDLIRAL